MLTAVYLSILQHKLVIPFATWKFHRYIFCTCGSEIRYSGLEQISLLLL